MILLQEAVAELEPIALDLGTAGRWLQYAATLTLVGAAAFGVGLRRAAAPVLIAHRDALARGAARLGLVAAALLLPAVLLKLAGQAHAVAEPDPVTRTIVTAILESAWGRGLIVQGLAAILALGGFLLAARGVAAGWAIALLDALLVAGSAPLTGHALSGRFAPPAAIALHVLHELGGGLWLGQLLVLTVAGLGTAWGLEASVRRALVAALVGRASNVFLFGAGAAALTGGVLAYAYVGSLGALTATSYGRALLVKVGVLGTVALLGAWNWRVVTPRLDEDAGAPLLLRSAQIELALGALLLLATAVVVNLGAPGLE
ncbi:MAG: CopD family protein [Gemmatimonadales bacterium]|nr:CopD family protein [Gemmatimonadales bacterium]